MKVIDLRNQHIQVNRLQSPDGEEVWQLAMTDKGSGDVITLAFSREVRDSLVAQMTSGIVIANGQPPAP
jgi:hypothetical protein